MRDNSNCPPPTARRKLARSEAAAMVIFFVRVRRSSHGKQRDKCKHHQCKSARRLHHILLKFLSEKANSGSSGNYLWCKFYGEYSWSVQQADHRNMLHYRTTVKVLNVIRIAIITGLSVLLAL
jgi:hypothetical protein